MDFAWAISMLPSFLHDAFDEADLNRHAGSIAVLDADDQILWVNEAWHRFAAEGGVAPERVGEWRSYVGAIAEPLRSHYAAAFANARATGTIFEQDYDCSSAELHRSFRLRALPFGQTLVLEHTLRVEEPWSEEPHPPLEDRYFDATRTIAQCGNCRRIRDPMAEHDTFHWVPAWIRAPHPRTSHVICVLCAGFYWRR